MKQKDIDQLVLTAVRAGKSVEEIALLIPRATVFEARKVVRRVVGE